MTLIDPEWTAWRRAGEEVIFLDLVRDRYFRLSEPANSAFRTQVECGELEEWRCPKRLPKPAAWIDPDTSPPAAGDNRLNVAGIAAAFWMQRRLERRIKTSPFHRVLIDVRATVERRVNGRDEPHAALLPDVVRDFDQARLLRSAPDQCLPRSLALILRCASLGIRAHAVIGIKPAPFEAHCWAQRGRAVLSDPLENISAFTPILVI